MLQTSVCETLSKISVDPAPGGPSQTLSILPTFVSGTKAGLPLVSVHTHPDMPIALVCALVQGKGGGAGHFYFMNQTLLNSVHV